MTNKQYWSAKIGEGIRHYKATGIDGWRFLTITSHEKNETFSQTVYVWPKAWRNLSNRLRYKYKGIKYVLLPEKHKNGRLHVHALASGNVGQTWLKKKARKSGLGFMDESLELTSIQEGVSYVTKYLTMTLEVESWPSKFRRIKTSIRWPILDPRPDFDALDIDWEYLATYPSDGLGYLAKGIEAKNKVDVIVL